MRTRNLFTVAALAAAVVAVGPASPSAAAADPRESHVTTVGVHNTYQKATFPYIADALDSGTGLIELDVWADSLTRQWRVNHELFGQSNNCTAGGLRTGSRDRPVKLRNSETVLMTATCRDFSLPP